MVEHLFAANFNRRQIGRKPVNADKMFATFRKKLEEVLQRRLLTKGLIFANLRKYTDELHMLVGFGMPLLATWQHQFVLVNSKVPRCLHGTMPHLTFEAGYVVE